MLGLAAQVAAGEEVAEICKCPVPSRPGCPRTAGAVRAGRQGALVCSGAAPGAAAGAERVGLGSPRRGWMHVFLLEMSGARGESPGGISVRVHCRVPSVKVPILSCGLGRGFTLKRSGGGGPPRERAAFLLPGWVSPNLRGGLGAFAGTVSLSSSEDASPYLCWRAAPDTFAPVISSVSR